MYTGSGFYNDTCSDNSNPVYTAYRDWLQKTLGEADSRPSWDVITVYTAITGTDESLMWEEKGTDIVSERGLETWDATQTENNEVNLQYSSDEQKKEVTDILNKLMCEGNRKMQSFMQ